MRKKILISAYAISPFKGSEYASAWNTVTNLAKMHDVWVLYGMSDDHMGDTQTLRQYIKDNPGLSVRFIEVKGGAVANAINLLNKAGAGWFFYFAYYLWQKKALQAAQNLLRTVDIDVVHQLGPIGFREPGFLWQLDKPMVWGPIGGMMHIDKKLLKGKPLLFRLKFLTKNAINYLQLNFSGRIRAAFEHADVLLAATTNGRQVIKQKFGKDSIHLAETWLVPNATFDAAKFDTINQRVKLVWSGTHTARKNLELCLYALSRVTKKNWLLHVLGQGPLTDSLKALADDLCIGDNIIWHGQITRSEAIKVMQASHLHVLTSIAEDNPNVLYEALSYGIPTLTIDHFGMADVVCSDCGIKIPVDENDAMACDMALIIDHLLINHHLLKDLANTTMLAAENFSAGKRLAKLDSIYKEAILRYGRRADHTTVPQILMG